MAQVLSRNCHCFSRARKRLLYGLKDHHIGLLHFRICHCFIVYFCDPVPVIWFLPAVIASVFLVLCEAQDILLGLCNALHLVDPNATLLGSYIQFYIYPNSFRNFIVTMIFLRFESFWRYSKELFQVAATILFLFWLLRNPRLSEIVI